MKNLTLIILSLILGLSLSAQEEKKATFSRKGNILVETGYSFSRRLGVGSGTGASVEFGGSGGGTLYNISIEGGYFISDDFAIKGRLGVLGRGNNGRRLANFSAGGKYYIIGRIPAELTLGVYGNTSSFIDEKTIFFLGNARIGYGIPIAKNINLEPFVGILFGEDFDPEDTRPVGQFGISFSMFL